MKKISLIFLIILLSAFFLHQYQNDNFLFQSRHVITVQEKDTLWKIASDINSGNYDNRKIIIIIKQINNLDTSIINPGQKLIIPSL